MNAVLSEATIDESLYDELYGTRTEFASFARGILAERNRHIRRATGTGLDTEGRTPPARLGLRDMPRPRTSRECVEWHDRWLVTGDPRWLCGLKAAAALMALALRRKERARALAGTNNPRLRAFLIEQFRAMEGLLVSEAMERAMTWEPAKGSLATHLHLRITGLIRDTWEQVRKEFAHEAPVADTQWHSADIEYAGGYRRGAAEASDQDPGDDADGFDHRGRDAYRFAESDADVAATREEWGRPMNRMMHLAGRQIVSGTREGAAEGVRFRDEPELAALIKSLAAGLYDDLDYKADERAVLFHQLIPQANGEPGLNDRELAQILKRPVSWVSWKRRQLIGEMREAIAARGLTP